MEWVARTTKSKARAPLARIGPFPLPLAAAAIALAAAIVLAMGHAHRTDEAARPAEAPIQSAPAPATTSRLDDAIARGDVPAARAEWSDAYRSLLRNPDWRRMAALGDAALEIARLDGAPRSGDADARRAYLAAMFRARAASSVDGALRAAESFAMLGDRDVAEEGLRIADALAVRSGDGRLRDRVQALRTRLYGAPATPEPPAPIDATTWDQGP